MRYDVKDLAKHVLSGVRYETTELLISLGISEMKLFHKTELPSCKVGN